VLTNGGLLLEHFARLATNIAGTAAAIVGVLGRRNEQGLRRASYGLSPGQMTAIQDIEEILDRGHSLTIIPDLAQDGRFGGETPAFERLGFRFLVHMKLISPGGERVGFILLLDEIPRQGLTGDQVTTLGHIASMVMADRQREQRHLHLMHVADRALRVDRMLRLVSEADSCADALTNLLEALCRFHGAAVGQIWQLIRPDKPLVEISRYHHDQQSGYVFQSLQPLITLNEMTMDAIRRNTPHAIEFSRLEGFQPPNDSDGSGFTGHVCIPIWAQQQRFGISLAFTTENTGLDAVVADITSLGDTIRPALIQKVTEERMRFAAHHDDLTQLSNRLMFQERLRKAIAGARSGKQSFALLCLDLDGFKLINDTHGHGFGDSLLVGVAQRLRESVRETDTVARMGGDEFAIIQLTDNQPEDAIALAKRLVDIVTQPFELAGRQALVGVSIGIALYPNHGESPDLLLRDADQALYRAKKAGRKTWALFDPDVECSSQEPFLVEQDLKDAITRGDFTLAYQPVCDSRSLHIVGFEALLRWRHPLLGSIQPDLFIPLAEKSGLIVQLGRWVLETACAEAASWDRPALLSVNLSPLQFRQPDLPEQIADVLSRTGLPPSRLGLEVTEGLLLDESDLVLQTIRRLQALGIRIMLDDFGTAYASMNYLRRFPFNGIKIDKSFIRGICNDEVTLAIVQAILSLAARLGLVVVAEGVESERELNVLRKLGCRFIQGYLTGRASDGQHANALLRQSWAGNAWVGDAKGAQAKGANAKGAQVKGAHANGVNARGPDARGPEARPGEIRAGEIRAHDDRTHDDRTHDDRADDPGTRPERDRSPAVFEGSFIEASLTG
jgi:diguanylate cyclase (GGDEF)-like protein